MRIRPAVSVAGVAAALLLGVGVLVQLPLTEEGYRQTARTSAQEAVSAGGTAVLLGRSADRVLGPYLTVALDAARSDVTAAAVALLDEDVPSAAARGYRDQLAPLFSGAAAAIADMIAAADDDDEPGIDRAVGALTPLLMQLETFVEANQ